MSALTERVSGLVTERSCAVILVVAFTVMAALVASVPYDPSGDLADATTNLIWAEQYSHGAHHIPYDEWTYGTTQSVVVLHDGEYVVVNEKGPGHVVMLLPFYMIGMEKAFPALMMGLAVLGTYMLGKRLFGWQVGFVASLLVIFNLVVVVMWYRYYWTDASTMHLLVLAFWLMVEGNYRWNGRSLDPRDAVALTRRGMLEGGILCLLSGLAFGLSVSTRYPTGLLAFAFAAYLLGFYLLRTWPSLKARDIRAALSAARPLLALGATFAVGLLLVLVPLMQYNSEYFGGPLNSGYDATSLMDFNRTGELDVRNTSATWIGNVGSYVSTAASNLVRLAPMFISRMPALLLLPIGIYCLRRRKPELAALLLWTGINLFTYLSLEWVTMYARSPTPWEPRYWLPSLPAISILGAVGVTRLAGWAARRQAEKYGWPDHDRRAAKTILVGLIAGALVLWTAVPAASYLSDPVIYQGPAPPGPDAQAIPVTTDQLALHPEEYRDRAVLLPAAVVRGLGPLSVASLNSSASVPVRFAQWPPGTAPVFGLGQNVTVRGMFVSDPPVPGMPPSYSLLVRYETPDFARLLSPPPD